MKVVEEPVISPDSGSLLSSIPLGSSPLSRLAKLEVWTQERVPGLGDAIHQTKQKNAY